VCCTVPVNNILFWMAGGGVRRSYVNETAKPSMNLMS
jgi:hypothetical protein